LLPAESKVDFGITGNVHMYRAVLDAFVPSRQAVTAVGNDTSSAPSMFDCEKRSEQLKRQARITKVRVPRAQKVKIQRVNMTPGRAVRAYEQVGVRSAGTLLA
jgi:hypothetical protein